MDVDFIRSRFIQDNLRRALAEKDRERAIGALQAFQLYFQWFAHKVPDPEKVGILAQLARLEQAQAAHRGSRASDSSQVNER